jgi:hypothetical protein
MKTRQLSANAKVIVDWLKGQNYSSIISPALKRTTQEGLKKNPLLLLIYAFLEAKFQILLIK